MIPLCIPEIKGNEWNYIKECLDTNWVSSAGSYVDKFENDFSKYMETLKSVVTVNGTAALEIALRALGVGAGDEVIVPSMTFISPVNVVKYVGATPVFVDICSDTWVMDVEKVEALITEKTKVIIPVHIYGNAVDMDTLMELAKKHKLYVIEDATESLGSEYNGKKLGSIGHVGCFSFNGNKIITTGAGGMLTTNIDAIGEKAKFLSTQTKIVLENKAFYHPEVGYNYRMPNILAAMGCAQLEMINEYIMIKRKNADLYNKLLSEVKGISLPTEREKVNHVQWLYSVLIEDDFAVTRDEVIKRLAKEGIESRPFFMAVHEMPPYKECKTSSMEVTNKICKTGINLPSSVGLKSEEIEKICNILKDMK